MLFWNDDYYYIIHRKSIIIVITFTIIIVRVCVNCFLFFSLSITLRGILILQVFYHFQLMHHASLSRSTFSVVPASLKFWMITVLPSEEFI